MKSTLWPIHWSYSGDIERCKEFHGEGRAMIGNLKNMTYGGANLGSNKMRKTFENGVEITAIIRPGVDEVKIYVPLLEEKKKEEEEYFPYLWIGAKIVGGGIFHGFENHSPPQYEDTSVDPWNERDFTLILSVWEPPQSDKDGSEGTAAEPNQIQLLCTWRHEQQGWQPWLCSTSDCYPLQEDRYWQDDPTEGYGGQAYMKRINMTTFGVTRYPSGPTYFFDLLNFEHTDDYLMDGGLQCPYDPLWNGKLDDDAHIWEKTAWCDPLTAHYEFPKGPPPIKVARGTVPSGAKTGGTLEYPNPDNTWWDFYDTESGSGEFSEQAAGDITKPMNGVIIPGLYIATVSLRCGSECPGYELPIQVEIEARVGHPYFGRMITVNDTVTINAEPAHAIYICNTIPYGYYRETHLSTGEIDRFGDPVPDGYGPNPHTGTAMWTGAVLINAWAGTISFVDNFDFNSGVDKSDYKLHSYNTVWPSSNDDYPYGSSQIWSIPCLEQPCISYPCAERLSAYQMMKAQGLSTADDGMMPWVERIETGSSGPFIYTDDYAHYLLGRKARVVCTWFGAEDNPLYYQSLLYTYVLYSIIQICDDEYPTYNGEIFWGLQYGLVEGQEIYDKYWDHNMYLGEEVYIIYPNVKEVLKIIPVTYPNTLLLRKETAQFDAQVGTPDGY